MPTVTDSDVHTSARPVWLLGAVVAALLALAVISCGWLAVRDFDGYDWPDASSVSVDGEAHVVELDAGERALLWDLETSVPPSCAVTEAATGEPVALVPDDGGYHRGGGTAGDYREVYSLASTSGAVSVTCERRSVPPSRDFVYVEAEPALPPALAAWGRGVVVPLGLAGAALVLALAGGVQWVVSRRARRSAPTRAA